MTGNTLPRLQTEDVLNLKIPIPPLATQQKIVSIMEAAQASKKQKEQQAKKLLDSIDAYVLDQLGITLPEPQPEKKCFVIKSSEVKNENRFDPFYFKYAQERITCNKYQLKQLKDFVVIEKGKSITKETITEGSYPVIAGGQSSPYFINEYNYKGNIITISASGAYAGYVWYHSKPIFASDCNVIFSINEKTISTYFIYAYLKSRQQFIYCLQQGAGQPHVYARDLEKIQIPLPPFAIQQTIATEVQKRITQAQQLKEQAKAEYEQAKQAIEQLILN